MKGEQDAQLCWLCSYPLYSPPSLRSGRSLRATLAPSDGLAWSCSLCLPLLTDIFYSSNQIRLYKVDHLIAKAHRNLCIIELRLQMRMKRIIAAPIGEIIECSCYCFSW